MEQFQVHHLSGGRKKKEEIKKQRKSSLTCVSGGTSMDAVFGGPTAARYCT